MTTIGIFINHIICINNMRKMEGFNCDCSTGVKKDNVKKAEAEFYESLVANGQIVDVEENFDTEKLPSKVTHVRLPDNSIKRIRFNGYM